MRLASVVASSVTLAVRVVVSSRRKVEGRQTLRGEASSRFSTCASAVTGAGAGRGGAPVGEERVEGGGVLRGELAGAAGALHLGEYGALLVARVPILAVAAGAV
eukprot:COSAG01_NODE_2106_length_8416_cov_47.839485_2_plen_104_part_00